MHPKNWSSPYQGLGQSLIGRAVSTGLWFPLERMARDMLMTESSRHSLTPVAEAALAGQLAGAANALLMAPLAMIRYQTWGQPDSERGVLSRARTMYQEAGPSSFYRGLGATVARDCVFGGTFGALRQRLRVEAEHSPAAGATGLPVSALHFAADTCSAGVATTISAPLNYARNMQCAPTLHPSLRAISPPPFTQPPQTSPYPPQAQYHPPARLRIRHARDLVAVAGSQRPYTSHHRRRPLR